MPTGTPVMAAGSGTIQFAGVQHGYGNFIIVNHGNGYATATNVAWGFFAVTLAITVVLFFFTEWAP